MMKVSQIPDAERIAARAATLAKIIEGGETGVSKVQFIVEGVPSWQSPPSDVSAFVRKAIIRGAKAEYARLTRKAAMIGLTLPPLAHCAAIA